MPGAAAVMDAVGAGLARGVGSGLGVVGRGLVRLKDTVTDVPVAGEMTQALGAVGDGVTGAVAGVRDVIAGGRGGKHVDRDDKGEDELIGRSLFVSATGDDGRAPGGAVVGARRFVKIVNTGDQVIDTRIDFADTFDAGLAGAPIRVAISTIDGDAHAKNQLGWHGEGVPGVEESWRAFTLRAGAERGFALALRPRSVTLIELSV